MIAALFVETEGCYFGLPNVDLWDRDRDARAYPGVSAVVAHPPCACNSFSHPCILRGAIQVRGLSCGKIAERANPNERQSLPRRSQRGSQSAIKSVGTCQPRKTSRNGTAIQAGQSRKNRSAEARMAPEQPGETSCRQPALEDQPRAENLRFRGVAESPRRRVCHLWFGRFRPQGQRSADYRPLSHHWIGSWASLPSVQLPAWACTGQYRDTTTRYILSGGRR